MAFPRLLKRLALRAAVRARFHLAYLQEQAAWAQLARSTSSTSSEEEHPQPQPQQLLHLLHPQQHPFASTPTSATTAPLNA